MYGISIVSEWKGAVRSPTRSSASFSSTENDAIDLLLRLPHDLNDFRALFDIHLKGFEHLIPSSSAVKMSKSLE